MITLTHDAKFDIPALAIALRSRAGYVGALGSRRTHAKRVDRLTAELEETKRAFAAPAATIDSLRQQSADLQAKLDSSEASAADLSQDNERLRNRQAQYKNTMPLQWVAGAVAACLVGGFLLGLWWTDYRSRRRHGGIRIY